MTGSNYERELKKDLTEQGWLVFRSAGSFSCDLVALRPEQHRLIEVKSKKAEHFYTSDDKEQFDMLNDLAKEGFDVYYYIRWKNKKDKWSKFKLPLKPYPVFRYEKNIKEV